MISDVVPVAMLFVKTQPTLERIMFGLYKSVLGFAIITASTLAASAVRNRAPMFPGFSGASATKINGFLVLKFKCFRAHTLVFAMAITPSVVALCANFWYTSLEI